MHWGRLPDGRIVKHLSPEEDEQQKKMPTTLVLESVSISDVAGEIHARERHMGVDGEPEVVPENFNRLADRARRELAVSAARMAEQEDEGRIGGDPEDDDL